MTFGELKNASIKLRCGCILTLSHVTYHSGQQEHLTPVNGSPPKTVFLKVDFAEKLLGDCSYHDAMTLCPQWSFFLFYRERRLDRLRLDR